MHTSWKMREGGGRGRGSYSIWLIREGIPGECLTATFVSIKGHFVRKHQITEEAGLVPP